MIYTFRQTRSRAEERYADRLFARWLPVLAALVGVALHLRRAWRWVRGAR